MPSLDSYLLNPTRRAFLKGMAAAGAATAVFAALPGCSGGAAGGGEKVFRWAQANADLPFDMQRLTDSTCSTIAEAVVEGLLYWNDDLELVCALAEEMPEWSEDGLTLTAKLKQGVKFHNGADFTAEDVKYTFERLFRPKTGAYTTYMYDIIEGAKEMIAGEADELSGLEIVDDYTVAFHVTTPYASFLQNLGLSFVGIFPHEACEEAGTDWGIDGNLIGTGPYKFVSGDSSKIVLEKNEEYHGGEPALDRVEVSFIDDNNTKVMSFVNGEVDACDLDSSLLDQYKDDEQVSPHITYFDTLGTYFMVLNLKDEAFQDVRVREALSLAINREEFVETMLAGAGVPAFGFLAPGIPGNLQDTREVFPYDPERAKQLLEEAGAKDISFTATCASSSVSTMLTAIQSYWKEIGVSMEIEQIDGGVYSSDQAAGNLQCVLQSWFPLYANADNNMYTFFYSSVAATKSSFYDNPEFDALMDEARTTLDDDARADLYRQADEILTWKDYACLPVYYPKKQFLSADGVQMKCGNMIYHFNDVTMG